MPLKNIYIVGFMATGKTALAKELSRQLKQGFLDLDSLIEQRQGRKISRIFADDGEAHFRSLEKQTLKEASRKQGLVVSCGGGIVLDKENIRLMKQTGVIICLSSRPGVIVERSRGHKHRPLLNVDNPEQRIKELLKIRAPFYVQADYTIDTSDLTIPELANKILEYIKQ
ncbi:MAG: shikimate kinase [Candidatus Omnitrophota bacterium]